MLVAGLTRYSRTLAFRLSGPEPGIVGGWTESQGSSSRRPRVTRAENRTASRNSASIDDGSIHLECHHSNPRRFAPYKVCGGARRCTPQIFPCAGNLHSRRGAAGPGIPGDWIRFGWGSADLASPTFARLPFPGSMVYLVSCAWVEPLLSALTRRLLILQMPRERGQRHPDYLERSISSSK